MLALFFIVFFKLLLLQIILKMKMTEDYGMQSLRRLKRDLAKNESVKVWGQEQKAQSSF